MKLGSPSLSLKDGAAWSDDPERRDSFDNFLTKTRQVNRHTKGERNARTLKRSRDELMARMNKRSRFDTSRQNVQVKKKISRYDFSF